MGEIMKKIIIGILISVIIISSTFSAALVIENRNSNNISLTVGDDYTTIYVQQGNTESQTIEKSIDKISLNKITYLSRDSINTSVDTISPYNQQYSPLNITA